MGTGFDVTCPTCRWSQSEVCIGAGMCSSVTLRRCVGCGRFDSQWDSYESEVDDEHPNEPPHTRCTTCDGVLVDVDAEAIGRRLSGGSGSIPIPELGRCPSCSEALTATQSLLWD